LRPVIAGLGMLAASLIALAATRIIARFPGLHDSDAALVEALA
jgi:hypothetical protein